MNRLTHSRFLRGAPAFACLLVAAATAALGAEGPAPAGAGDFSAYRIIGERNIFNAARSGRSSAAPRETRRPVRVESFALVGTMSYEKGHYAFFDGSSPEFRKALRCGDLIAGHTVREISPKWVRLEHEGKSVEVRVNTQMKREDDGPWRVSDRTESYSGSPGGTGSGSASSSPTPAGAPASSDSSGDVSEVLKRLMEQREKEMK
jgi:hypothetical protein